MKKVLAVSCMFLLMVTLAGCSFEGLFSDTKTIKDKHEIFQVTVPSNLAFEDNDNAKDYKLAVYSSEKGIYLFGNSYTSTVENLEERAGEDRTSYTEEEGIREVSELSKMEIQDYEAYTYNYQYTDESIETDFYTQVLWVQTAERVYVLDLEVEAEYVDEYKDILNTIAESFVEI